MTPEEFISKEIAHAKTAANPNALSARFVQLHELGQRSAAEAEEYQTLYKLMYSRWRWHTGSLEAGKRKRKAASDPDHT